ncbi:MAG: thymidine kinase [Ignavibacteriae bacterium HGW-Ignavibacteriae-2]|jgi:thymidine kinase|nr:thymidine kinase [Bacteroidota bacterium]PKL89128.1 MAG: thymidine kinase [Ignavibacteriae bacterium HGW-Ignavibacteriae-2]
MTTFTPHFVPADTGWVEVIVGCMFSGKTEELIRRLRRAQIAKLDVKIFKPEIDQRYSKSSIVSHSEQALASILVKSSSEILELAGNASVIGIDEGQFFDNELINVCNILADKGVRVIVAGLDQDYRGIPFEPMHQLLAIAEYITKTLAICVVCGNPAGRTQRTIKSGERVLVGAVDSYEARCRKHHYIPESE